ncbi:MAG: 4a-hydroxytetrahydrobiopterin dehydratase [Granulicella sp.]
MAKLSEGEIKSILAAQPQWKVADGALTREWVFKDFVEAMTFVNRIAAIAEAAGHHPDIDIRYNKVRLSLISHDLGGITERDAAFVTHLQQET